MASCVSCLTPNKTIDAARCYVRGVVVNSPRPPVEAGRAGGTGIVQPGMSCDLRRDEFMLLRD